jgi:uncharacterized protein
MKILFDINHPAHVHFFKNLIRILRQEGDEVHITARQKEMTGRLLDAYGLEYRMAGRRGGGALGLGRELLEHESFVYRTMKENGVELVMSIAGTFNVHACRLLSIPSLVFTDTECARFQNAITFPFARKIVTPACYKGDLGKKHVRYDGYHELAYLHPGYFTPDQSILGALGVEKGQKYSIIRFVSWKATHDFGHKGLSAGMRMKAVEEFSRYGRVFITSESKMPDHLEKYRLDIPPQRIHDALYYASLLFGESATMASECSVLGTPAIYLDDSGRGYTDEQERLYGSVFNFRETIEDQGRAIGKGAELLGREGAKEEWGRKRERLLKDKIDVTCWVADMVRGYREKSAYGKK